MTQHEQSDLGFAILGAGMVAEYHLNAIQECADQGARLVGVGHYNPARYEEISERFGVPSSSYDELLADPAGRCRLHLHTERSARAAGDRGRLERQARAGGKADGALAGRRRRHDCRLSGERRATGRLSAAPG